MPEERCREDYQERPWESIELAGSFGFDAADAQLERILDIWGILAERTGNGTPHDRLILDLRSRTIGRYPMLYTTSDGRVELLRIVHTARDLRDAVFD